MYSRGCVITYTYLDMLSGPTRQMSSVGCCRRVFLKLYKKQVLCSSQCSATRTVQTETSNTSNANTKEARTPSHTGRKYVSNLYQNLGNIYPTGNRMVCKSHKLFLYASIMQQCHFGGFNLLPLGQRVYDKLVRIIDHELEIIGCQKMSMTTLVPAKFWKKTGRWDDMGNELFRIKDRKNVAFCLGPTHEEVITNILASGPSLSFRRLPIKMYQITRKFRDENSPKYGFLRSREFEMKDLYTFDATLEDAAETYQSVCTAYTRILDKLEMDYDIVIGSTGNIGGSMSHEFQIRAKIGEDTIHVCKKCGFGANAETTEAKEKNCLEESCELLTPSSIEVGHSFLLGTKYSEPFNAKCFNKTSKPGFYQMGCYGLGVSRIMQACVEVLSTEKEIAWPRLIAPYQICIIPMESEEKCFSIAESMSDELNKRNGLSGEVVIDDRDKRVTFRRFEAKAIGYPYIITIKDKALQDSPLFEITDTRKNEIKFMTWDQIMDLASTIQTV